MTDTEQKRIFSQNLNEYLRLSGKTQIEVANSIHVSQQVFNTWCRGVALPRMGKVQLLADYFRIKTSDLIEDKTTSSPAADPVLSDRDIALLEKYHSLNSTGKDKLDERADELCEMEKYKKDTANSAKAG